MNVNGDPSSVSGLWRWFAVTLFSVLLAVIGVAWQNQRHTLQTVAQELRQQVGKHEAEVAALKARVELLEWYSKGRYGPPPAGQSP